MKFILKSDNWKQYTNKLELLGSDPSKKKQKGNSFEILVKLYLSTEPIYKSNLKNIWLHNEIPQQIIDKLCLPQPEIGIDIIAEDIKGYYWAIQCKFKQDPEDSIKLGDVSTFFAITERKITSRFISQRLICTSSYSISNRITKHYPDKLGYITYYEFSKLDKENFDRFRNVINGSRVAYKSREPRKHQLKAIKKFLDTFKNSRVRKGKIIHPCGSGKSLTGYWCFEQIDSSSVVIAVPSLALVKQILRDWTREAVSKNFTFDWIAVCSDEDVSNSDDPIMSSQEIGIITTTRIEDIIDFLRNNNNKKKVLVATYQSSHLVCKASMQSNFSFDLGIFDEAHKTVGNKKKPFAIMLWQENIKIDFRLFMTATERVYKGDSDKIVSMDNVEVYGRIIDELSFREALEQKPPILSDYKIITIGISSNEIKSLINDNTTVTFDGHNLSYDEDANTIAAAIALRKTIMKKKLKHTLSFHSSIKRARKFRDLNVNFSKIVEGSSSISSFHVSGKDGTGIRTRNIERFLNTEPSLMTNARCLTEGVDIPEIDAVLFADPKQSKIDIVQAAGRALRKAKEKEFGYIIIPVIIDEEDYLITETTFKQIVEVISALGVSDKRIIDEFRLIVSGHNNSQQFERNNIIIEDYPPNTRINISKLIKDLQIKIWNRLSFALSAEEDSSFFNWMQEHSNITPYTQKKYMGAIRKISNDLIRQNLYINSLTDLMIQKDPEEIMKVYFEVPENSQANERGHRTYSAAFRKLIEFHKYHKKKND